MKQGLQKFFFIAALAAVSTVAQANSYTNVWTGAYSDEQTAWGQPDNWNLSIVPSLGNTDQYGAYFNISGDTAISLGWNNRSAIDVVIGESAGAFTFNRPSSATSALTLRHNGSNYPSFLNLSGNTAVFNVPVNFGYGGSTVSWSGGSVLNNTITTSGESETFYFAAQAPSTDEAMRTTTLNGASSFSQHCFIETNHIVSVGNSLTVAGQLRIRGHLKVADGSVVHSPIVGVEYSVGSATFAGGSTIRTGSLGPANTDFRTGMNNVTIAGDVTLDTTGYDTTTIGTKLRFDDGARLLLTGGGTVTVEENSPAIGRIAVAGNVTLASWPLADGGTMAIIPADIDYGKTVTILTVKNADAAKLLNSFELTLDALPAIVGGTRLTVEQSSNDAIVKIAYPNEPVTKQSGTHAWNEEAAWSNNEEASSGCDYLVQRITSTDYRLNTPAAETTEFPGDSLTVVGATAASQAFVAQKSRYNTIGKLYLGAYGTYHFQSYDSGQSTGQWLRGNVYISSGTAGSPAYFRASHQYACTLEAGISGDGELRFVPFADDKYDFNLTISGDNSNYLGKMIFDKTTSRQDIVTISTAGALGGNPASELTDGVRLNNAVLKVADDVSFTAVNRIWTIYRASSIEVADGKTVVIPSPFKYVKDGTAPSLEKKGAGTLVLLGPVKSATEATFTVSTGALEVKNKDALAGVETVSFADGTTLIVPLAGNGDNGFVIDGTLSGSFAIDYDFTGYEGETPPKTLALFSVKGTTATVTPPDVTFAKYPKYTVRLVAEDVTIDGTAYVRYSAKFNVKGLVVIFR